MDKKLSRALKIGSFSIATYLASYITRNILSVSTPEMIKEDFFTKEYTGLLSSTCFIFYAVGQLVNGFLGDRIHPKVMVAAGLGLSSVATLSVPCFNSRILHFAAFALIGFGLSMLRGPLMKIISENTTAAHARIICTLFSMSGFAGPLVASLLSMLLSWRAVFTVVGAASVFTAAAAYLFIANLERKGEMSFVPVKTNGLKSIAEVFKLPNFPFFMLVSSVGEVASTSITFWIPTYTTEHLGFSESAAATVYSVISLSSLFAPFITLLLYEKLIHNSVRQSFIMYGISALFFIGVRFITSSILNIALFLAAKMSASCASSLVWTNYIPSLARSGRVSSANGVMDGTSYAIASASNAVFSAFVGILGWNGIVNMWCAVMLFGAAVSVIKLTKTAAPDEQ